VPHLINNAYGLQCSKCCHLVETACRTGRVDAYVQSTDKNFLVPVGGAVIAAPKAALVDKVSQMYPGRASMSPLLDVFITLVGLGASGWKKLREDRKTVMTWFQPALKAVVEKHDLRLLDAPQNKISLAVDVTSLEKYAEGGRAGLAFLGSMLFTRRVSGPRVVLAGGEKGAFMKSIDGHMFENYGAHHDEYPHCYLTAAAAIGATQAELEVFLQRLDESLADFKAGTFGER